jgi:hypothetical protein
MIQYDYGKTDNGKIINISQVNKNYKEKYFCISCNNELIPKIGRIREHHFAHKNKDIICSKENYFHFLGKKIFFNTYIDCIKNSEPFYIGIREIQCKNNMNYKCKNIRITNYNLLEYFDKIEMETFNGKFIPDLRLFNQSNSENIFIEIYYSSRISEEKINSNNRIIEIQVKNENDLEIINNKVLDEGNDNLKFYNFKRKYENNEKCNNCIFVKSTKYKSNIKYDKIDICKYIVLRYDGKIECKIKKPSEFQLIKKNYRNIKKVDPNIDYTIQYKDFIEDCKNKKMKICDSW